MNAMNSSIMTLFKYKMNKKIVKERRGNWYFQRIKLRKFKGMAMKRNVLTQVNIHITSL